MERRAITVVGVVQGVGFRPFVYGLSRRLNLSGFVRNDGGQVYIEVEGVDGSLDRFVDELRQRPPPLARIESIESRASAPVGGNGFEIRQSAREVSSDPRISADVATCDDCVKELFDRGNRRWRYPFINCTNCGPRLTISLGAPYDRCRTTMAPFEMCADCRREYEDPADRRFHAQPVACAVCGPRLMLLDAAGRRVEGGDPLKAAAETLRRGGVVAIKGLGGFHLACDAADAGAVRELRRRKERDEKPFAVMARDVASAGAFCQIDEGERELMESRARPIVLLRKRAAYALAKEVAPGNPLVGVMLPYTPVHHLLLAELPGALLVMTSGNRSDEPIAFEDDDAVARLAGIADLFLTNDRAIRVRCDDSVMRVVGGRLAPVRRSRGYAPQPVALPVECAEAVLAVGGQLKSTFALGRGGRAVISHHLGDLDHFQALRAFERDVELYERLFSLTPRVIVHDLHPDYASTRYALGRGEREGVRCVAVQHHHAHMASCMAEHGLDERVIGVCFDGTGYGTDGAIWGGEFLVGDYGGFERAGYLRYVPLPGGEKAIHEPWRMALSHLLDAGAEVDVVAKRVDRSALRAAARMIERRFNAPLTSSVGRLFDAVASLAGVRDVVSFEAQAAVQLEWMATGTAADGSYPLEAGEGAEIDTRPMIGAIARDVAAGVGAAVIARRFHCALVDLVCGMCESIATLTGVRCVVLSGGVFLNALLTDEIYRGLSERGFRVFRHEAVPTNDGGLSFGQLAVGFSLLRNWRVDV